MCGCFKIGGLLIFSYQLSAMAGREEAGGVNIQRARWVFTWFNPSCALDASKILDNTSIKRAIIGKEVSNSGNVHWQGYIEFVRSYRRVHCLGIFSNAHWEPAQNNAVANYKYCSKNGSFITKGSFAKEVACISNNSSPSVGMVLRGLMDRKLRSQVLVSREYSDKMSFFDRAHNRLASTKKHKELYEIWTRKMLYPWQFQVLRMVMEQDSRKVMWVYDPAGNNGKTFLAFFLNICYGFTLLDGTITSRDLGSLLPSDVDGVVMDVCRASVKNVCYEALENVKDGYVVSGKYSGSIKRFSSPQCVVFSNTPPDRTKLSLDRWHVVTIGEGILQDLSKMSVVSPAAQYPFIEPPQLPSLDDNFDLRKFLVENLSEETGEIYFTMQ